MGSRKNGFVKDMLIAYRKRNRPIPIWVIAKTNRKFRRNPRRYDWRRSNIGHEIMKQNR